MLVRIATDEDEWQWEDDGDIDSLSLAGGPDYPDSLTRYECRRPDCANPAPYHLTDECDISWQDDVCEQRGRWAVEYDGSWTRWRKKSDARRWANLCGGKVRRWRREGRRP